MVARCRLDLRAEASLENLPRSSVTLTDLIMSLFACPVNGGSPEVGLICLAKLDQSRSKWPRQFILSSKASNYVKICAESCDRSSGRVQHRFE